MVQAVREGFHYMSAVFDVGFPGRDISNALRAIQEDFQHTAADTTRHSTPVWMGDIFIIAAKHGNDGLQKLCRYASLLLPMGDQARLVRDIFSLEGHAQFLPHNSHTRVVPLHESIQQFLTVSHRGRDRELFVHMLGE